jgi:hypothetical protein
MMLTGRWPAIAPQICQLSANRLKLGLSQKIFHPNFDLRGQ